MTDPKLKSAAEEIKAVLRKYDIIGNFQLASETHIEFVREFETSWSCAKMEGPGVIRIRSKLVDYPSKTAQKKSLEDTVGALIAFVEQGERDRNAIRHLLFTIGQTMQIDHMSKEE